MAAKVKRVGFLYVFIIAVAFLSYLVTVYQKNKPISLEARTEQRAQKVGVSLIESHFEQKVFLPDAPPKEERGLASANPDASGDGGVMIVKRNLSGEAGRDAWGQPFSFHVKGDGIKNSTLYIWSVGPNGTPDFKDVKDIMAQGASGDDILVSIPF